MFMTTMAELLGWDRAIGWTATDDVAGSSDRKR